MRELLRVTASEANTDRRQSDTFLLCLDQRQFLDSRMAPGAEACCR
jgi:hypothetical protein